LSDIRVTYSGFIAFAVSILGIFPGLVFTLMITRRLTPEDFGTWALILSIVGYFLISESFISFWSTRQISRGEEIAKTSLLSSTIISFLAIPIFVVYVFFISESSTVNFEIMLLGAVLLPAYFFSQTLTGINLGHKPQAVSFGIIVFEVLKIPFGLFLIVIFDLGVLGAIFTLLIATLGKIIMQLYFARTKLRNKFSFQTLRRWMKLSWVPLYRFIPNYVHNIDVALYPIITGTVLGVAFYHAAFALALLVGHASAISQALYPKLIADNKFEGIKKNLIHVLYFAIPLLGIAILFSKPALFALNPVYQVAWLIVIILSFKIFFIVLRTLIVQVITGKEQVDTEQNPKISKLIQSQLFRVPTITGIFNTIYIVGFVIILFMLKNQMEELELVTLWAIIGLGVEMVLTIFLWIYSRKFIKISFPFKNIIKFIIATLAFVLVFIITSDSIIIYEQSIYKFLPLVILQLIICLGIYLGITYSIDSETRMLFKSIIKGIKRK